MDPDLAKALEKLSKSYYGKYRGFVVANEDPQALGRVQLRIPSVLGEETTAWALPCAPYGGLSEQGLFAIPDVGAQVWVEFEEGNPDRPIWVGTFWRASDPAPSEASKPDKRVFKTTSGHHLLFDDEGGAETVRLEHTTGSKLEIRDDATTVLESAGGATLTLDESANSVELKDANGNTLTMTSTGTTIEDVNGNQIEMAPAGITVKGQIITIDGSMVQVGGSGGVPIIKGPDFLALFATHVHTTTVPGTPTSPPIPQGEMATLTTKTFAS